VDKGQGETDITKTIEKPIKMGVVSKHTIIPDVTDLRAYVKDNHLTIQANLDFTKAKEQGQLRPRPDCP